MISDFVSIPNGKGKVVKDHEYNLEATQYQFPMGKVKNIICRIDTLVRNLEVSILNGKGKVGESEKKGELVKSINSQWER